MGVRRITSPNNEFIFLVREDGYITQLSEDAVQEQILKQPNAADFALAPTTIGGASAYKETYHGSDNGIISDSYWVQRPGQRVLNIIVVTKHYDSRQIRDAQEMLNSFTFTN